MKTPREIVATGQQVENCSNYNKINNTYEVLCIYQVGDTFYELCGEYDCNEMHKSVVDSITSVREVEKVFITEDAWKYVKSV